MAQSNETGSMVKEPVLSVRDLEVEYRLGKSTVRAVNGLSFDLNPGQTLAIVGESGSGKSASMLALTRLIPSPPGFVTKGQVMFNGQNLLSLPPKELQKVRGPGIAMIFQDPMTALNPLMKIGRQITEGLEVHFKLSSAQAHKRAVELLKMVGIVDAEERFNDYPIQFSGGMRQRVMIASAIACNPKVLIADEPTTALDVTIQMQVIEVINRLRSETEMGVIWITHDLGVVAGLADKVIVMYAGRAVEIAAVDDLFYRPHHPYAMGLLRSVPSIAGEKRRRLRVIEGLPPDLTRTIEGCPFFSRCDKKMDICASLMPETRRVEISGFVACHWDVVTQHAVANPTYSVEGRQ
ncbi:ABC transporter ATP-binding protein [Aminobacter sp. Piv2-1]|uniref:ABC transporter ATP-binding protein n=1 Tax=Aminobacter sp. Piv2-1 TaxID=3031122 RepID=UPI0030EBE9F0